jgi:hypothetical protein
VNIYCMSECCPVGCGSPVIFVRAQGPGTIFCYCDGCGSAWRTPAEAQLESGVNGVTSPAYFAPNGVTLPTRLEVSDAGFGDAILWEHPSTDWDASVEELNRDATATGGASRS